MGELKAKAGNQKRRQSRLTSCELKPSVHDRYQLGERFLKADLNESRRHKNAILMVVNGGKMRTKGE